MFADILLLYYLFIYYRIKYYIGMNIKTFYQYSVIIYYLFSITKNLF